MAIADTRRGASQAELYEQRRLSMTDAERAAHDATISPAELQVIKYHWPFWARPNQLLPTVDESWQTWLIIAGRGYGKTRTGAETIRRWISAGFNYCNMIAPTADDARDICIEGESGILNICPERERPEYIPSKRQLRWPNGATSLIFTADEPDRLRGKQHMKLWCDELAAWRYLAEAWDQAMLGLRLGKNPQAIVTTTPRPLKEVKELVANPLTFLTRGTTYENRRNLAAAFYSRIITKYEGSRLGRQELQAEILEDRVGAIFQTSDIEGHRLTSDKFHKELFPFLVRVVGGVDPAASSNMETSDETGIVFAGVDNASPPHFYVFDDRSGIYSPEEWGTAVKRAYYHHKADKVIAERNHGGEMVAANLRHADANMAVKLVTASRGKVARAEPIATLYEQGRVHHVGTLSRLEDQMCDYVPGVTEDSPDRMDALVWALTELSESSGGLGLVDYLKSGMAESQLTEFKSLVQVTQQPPRPRPADAGQILGCPRCHSGCTVVVAGGQKKCNDCGNQWWPAGQAPSVYRGPSRSHAWLAGGKR
jgi:phage terminase large subunit-like protein